MAGAVGGAARRGAVLALLAALAVLPAAFAGCSCRPLLEVHRVGEVPEDAAVWTWSAADARALPELDALLRSEDRHQHAAWDADRTDAVWRHFGLDPGGRDNEVFVRRGEGVHRVRVLSC